MAEPNVLTNTSFTATELATFVETTSTKAGSDEIKYAVCVNGTDKYITGGAVATSDGTSNSPSPDPSMMRPGRSSHPPARPHRG